MNSIWRIAILFITLLIISWQSLHAQTDPIDIAELFDGHEGTFLLYDEVQDVLTVYNPTRATQRFPPFSTFKILNAAIALETGVVTDMDFTIAYDDAKYPPFSNVGPIDLSTWWRDHDLQSAMQYSVVWYFFEVALGIGQERMQQWVSDVDYGNQDVSFWVTDTPFGEQRPFWLGGGLEISAFEQMTFLRQLYNSELPFSERTVDIVQEILIREETDEYRLSGKTGTQGNTQFGWFVGVIEREDNRYFFVLNIDSDPIFRNNLLRRLLTKMEVLP